MASLHDLLAPEPQPSAPRKEPQLTSTSHASTSQQSERDHAPAAVNMLQNELQRGSTLNIAHPLISNDDFLDEIKPDNSNTTTSLPSTSTAAPGLTTTPTAQAVNKMRHLKKEDGIPLWRKDIQYDFLKLVFFNNTRCFRKYKGKDSEPKYTFAEIYIEAMANSSKCSKILKEKLLSDSEGAISVAMVCLLVNLGRMNTTLNFFPEMRAQLRTYHSIPALQAHQDPNAYKQLQDAPRLKSILKGATEDEPQPGTLEAIREAKKPRTNVVNLIFVLSQFAPKVSDLHFTAPCDFQDLVMRPTLSSESRARAFLWLVWWYLESDFTASDALNNPFGPGQYAENDINKTGVPQKVPALESLTEQQADLENVDTEEEKLFGEVKRKERIAILASDPSPAMIAMKRARKDKPLTLSDMRSEDEGSDAGWWKSVNNSKSNMDNDGFQTRSPSPVGRLGTTLNQGSSAQDMKVRSLLNSDRNGSGSSEVAPNVKKGPGRGNWRRNKPKSEVVSGMPALGRTITGDSTHHVPLLPNTSTAGDSAGPATPASGHYSAYTSFPINSISPDQAGSHFDHVVTPSFQAQKRGRGVTQHQSALMSHRRAQMEYLLDRSIRKLQTSARKRRRGVGPIVRAWERLSRLPQGYDSEEEFIKSRKARERERDEEGKAASRVHAKDADEATDFVIKRPRVYLGGFADSNVKDVGEEAIGLARSLRRARRRLRRWQEDAPGDAMIRREKHEQLRLQPRITNGRRHSAAGESEEDVEMKDVVDEV